MRFCCTFTVQLSFIDRAVNEKLKFRNIIRKKVQNKGECIGHGIQKCVVLYDLCQLNDYQFLQVKTVLFFFFVHCVSPKPSTSVFLYKLLCPAQSCQPKGVRMVQCSQLSACQIKRPEPSFSIPIQTVWLSGSSSWHNTVSGTSIIKKTKIQLTKLS